MTRVVLLVGVIGAIGLAFVGVGSGNNAPTPRALAPLTTSTMDTLTRADATASSHQLLQAMYQRQAALTEWGATLTIEIMDESGSKVKRGKVAVMQDQYRLETTEEKIVSNGHTLWVYTHKDGQLQISESQPDANNFFCYPTQLMQRYQQYCQVEEITSSDASRTIQFTATDNRAPFAQMQVKIDPVQYQIQAITVWETPSIGYAITINALYPQASFEEALFTFDERLVEESRIKDFR